jgi:tetratricopeptide (TPR) repeat protein
VSSTTAASLHQDYQKWDNFDAYDDMDEVSDDDIGADMDLDALSGPQDEVRAIQKHWKRETNAIRKAAREREKKTPSKSKVHVEVPTLPQGPEIQRPCTYRHASDPEAIAAGAIRRDYDKWKNFDADAAMLEMDNEGKTEEGDAMRMEARKSSAVLACEGYQKNREEYDLDQDIETQIGSLKKVIGQRLKDAAASKAEGNSLLRSGRAKEACRAYATGLETMEMCGQASVIMADTMADKSLRLIGDLHRNLAAAQLEVGDYEGTVSSCDEALKQTSSRRSDHGNHSAADEDEKALYRRAMALLNLGRHQDARKDIDALAAQRGDADPAVANLRAEDAKRP